jgi:Fe-S oxidoreductase
MAAKVLVINSPVFTQHNLKNTEDYLPPIGLGLVYSNISESHDIRFVDSIAKNMSVDEILNQITIYNPDFICINIFTTNYQLVKSIIEFTTIQTHWIIGGISTLSLHKEMLKWTTPNPIDIIYGDGEFIANAIINGQLNEIPTEEIQGKRFFKISNTSKYYNTNISSEHLNRNIFSNEPQKNTYGEQEIAIYTSRGCPYNCAYCVAAQSRNSELGPIRKKEIDSIQYELDILKSTYPQVTAIRILDDLFLSNKTSFIEAIQLFSKNHFSWRAMCHIKSIQNVDDDILHALQNSKCKELFIGIESGSAEILSTIHKTNDIELIKRSIERVLQSGINVKGYFICGFPGETEAQLHETYDLAFTLTMYGNSLSGTFRNSTFQFRPYFGTELYCKIVNERKLPYDYVLTHIKESKDLNVSVRNKSFNFDSGNFSTVKDDILLHYIQKMNSLNE